MRAINVFSTNSLLNVFSSSALKDGFPNGWGIATVGTIRLAPTVSEIGVTVQACTTGMPALSISFTIVAPQRVQVPQVEVRITASTPLTFSFWLNSSANAFEDATAVPFPTVE